ncbi:hypothetical protein ACRAWF_39725 [Streptomyces sp. L7]
MGTPVAEGQYWKVGGQDGSGPSLQVNRAAPGLWTFNRYAPGTDNCTDTLKCAQDPGTSATDLGECRGREAGRRPGLLKAVGQDDAKVDASQLMGAQRVVNAEPMVGGLPTHGWTTGLTVSAQGEVVGGSGQLAAPVKGDVYPVLSAQKTLALLNAAPGTDHRMGIGGCASPVPLKDRLEAPCGSSTAVSATPAQAPATVEHAVFGLASHSVAGKQTLVPSWLFEVKQSGTQDTFTVTYPAIDPKHLGLGRYAHSDADLDGDRGSARCEGGRLLGRREEPDRDLHRRGVRGLQGGGLGEFGQGEGHGDRDALAGQGLHHDRQVLPPDRGVEGAARRPEGRGLGRQGDPRGEEHPADGGRGALAGPVSTS